MEATPEHLDQSSMELTVQEAAVYDRQIRVWGLEAQKRMRGSRLLVIGCTAVIAETCKNIVLAGVKSVALLDNSRVTSEAAVSNYLVTPDRIESNATLASVCAESLAELNPMVELTVCQGSIEEQVKQGFDAFDAVLLGRSDVRTQEAVDTACRRSGKCAFFYVDCRGGYAYMFQDLHQHQYSGKAQEEAVAISFPSLREVLSTPWSKLDHRRFCRLFFAFRVVQEYERHEERQVAAGDVAAVVALGERLAQEAGLAKGTVPTGAVQQMVTAGRAELPAVCAVVGGILGQEVLKYVSKNGAPHKNHFFFDVESGEGIIEEIPPTVKPPVQRPDITSLT